jgi:hypothetical protein
MNNQPKEKIMTSAIKENLEGECVVGVLFETSLNTEYRYKCNKPVRVGDLVLLRNIRYPSLEFCTARVIRIIPMDNEDARKANVSVLDVFSMKKHSEMLELEQKLVKLEALAVVEAQRIQKERTLFDMLGEDHPLTKQMRELKAALGQA